MKTSKPLQPAMMYPNPLIKQNVKNTVKRQIKCFFLMCYIKWKKGRSTSISTSLVIKRWKTNVSFNKILKMRKNDGRSVLRMMPLRSVFLKNKYIFWFNKINFTFVLNALFSLLKIRQSLMKLLNCIMRSFWFVTKLRI